MICLPKGVRVADALCFGASPPASTIQFMGDLLRYDQAAALVAGHAAQLALRAPAVEQVKLGTALDRVLAHPLAADRDQPPFARSTRDGYACRAAEASEHRLLAIAGSSRAGDAPSGPLPPGSAWEIMTGAPIPAGADAVIMLEHVETCGGAASRSVRLLPPRTVKAGENLVLRGAQARQGEQLLAPGAVLRAGQIALAAACGCEALDVFVRPRVAILTTGDELVPVGAEPAPGQIRNSNGPMLAALVESAGGEPWILPTAADRAEALDAAITQAVPAAEWGADLLLITGGVSAGKFDLVEPALARAGAIFHFTGVKIQPGKPAVFAELPHLATEPVLRKTGVKRQDKDRTTCCIGLPGNPVSSAVTFLLFAAPLLRALGGRRDFGSRFALARLAGDVKSKPGLTRFLPAACNFELPEPRVSLVPSQGSGDLAALARSNCFLVIREARGHIPSGETVSILLL